jgi:hypothetical protein
MSDTMTMEEIQARFDREWVLLADPEWTEATDITAGKVLFHSSDHDEVWRRAQELPAPVHIAVLYIGRPPEDVVPML